jgi:hypothetical protein
MAKRKYDLTEIIAIHKSIQDEAMKAANEVYERRAKELIPAIQAQMGSRDRISFFNGRGDATGTDNLELFAAALGNILYHWGHKFDFVVKDGEEWAKCDSDGNCLGPEYGRLTKARFTKYKFD